MALPPSSDIVPAMWRPVASMRWTCVMLVVLSSGGCRRSQDDQRRVGIAIPSYVHAVAWIALDRGLWDEPSQSSRVEVMGGSAATMRALIGGSIDVGIAGGDAVLKANAAGADLVVIGALVNRFYHRIVSRERLATAEQLRGKRIGLAFLGGPQDMAVKYALAKSGLDYDKDVKILNLGKEFNRMAALRRGQIDATTSQSPPSLLAKLGLHVVADLPSWDVAFPYAVVVVKRSRLKSSRAWLKRMLAGLCGAIVYYRDNRDASLKIIARRIHGADVEKAAAERYRLSGPGMLSESLRPVRAAFGNVSQFLGRPAPEFSRLFDLSLLDELAGEGVCSARAGIPVSLR